MTVRIIAARVVLKIHVIKNTYIYIYIYVLYRKMSVSVEINLLPTCKYTFCLYLV